MIVQTVTVGACTPQTIVIGRRGTYDTMQIAFDLSYLIENYGSGTAVLAVKRSQDESAYPAVVTQEAATLLWTVNETDTAYVGSGECQLMWYVDGGLAKTIIYPMVVMRDILQTAEEPPDGYENWIEHLTELGAETQQNAQNAAQSATDAGAAKDAANEAVTHYPKIENGYWYVWNVTAQAYQNTNIKAEGEDGYSPEVTITSITGGHRVTITDKDHPQGQSFDVMDGQGGGGSSDYAALSNKPKINNVELNGNKTAHDLGLAAQTDIPTVPVQSVNGKTGAVVLDSGDIAYDESATYQAGSVGAELQEQTRHLNELVLVQDTQPTEPDNKIWIPEDGDQTFVVPEYSEFEQVANQLIEPSLLLPLTWTKGEAVNHSTGAVGTNSNGAVTNYYETDEARYIVLQLGEGVTTSRYIQFVTYQSDGTYVTGEQIAFSTVPYKVKTVKPGYKYRFGVTKPTAADIDDVIAMTEFQYTHLLDSEKGLAGKVADLEAKVPEFEHLKHDVNGGGDQISFVLERGTINTTTGEDSSSTILARSVGYYASDGNGLIISSPVGGTVIPYEYSAEDASGFVGTVGPAGGVTYVNSPCTLPTEAGKYYRFTFNLNNSATWNDPEEFFGDFEFVLANTYQVGLESRVTALEQESGSDKIFTGKVWVALGDSITYRGVDTPQGNPGYRTIVTDILGFTTYNKGIGSTSLGGANDTTAMCSTTRLNGVLHPDSSDSSVTPDFVTILGGANDLGTSMLIGDETEFAKSLEQKDRDTFIGAYSYIIEYLLGQNPTINIMILGTTWAHSDGVGSEYGKTYTEYSDASRKVAEYYGLPFVDLHGECGFNAFTMGAATANRIYSSDQIHPNQAGSEKIASLVAAKMIAAWKYTI